MAGAAVAWRAPGNRSAVAGIGRTRSQPEGGGPGNLAVTGFITGSNMLLQFAEDNGTTVHVNATLASHDQLNASLFTTSDPVPVTFSRLLRE